ncbi:MAG: hypothetical protein H6646_07680 [Anaerolineales bacterium]|nr:hypothetical protein [Anaerolineae bacterium]MCB0233033.1 hypothetical protein [Anaerolineae bacterium]MCB9142139.1 hypothetical protein [Anaerolineales bacterium]HRX02134.1 hypothetical protein [Anaerolineae bacterium]
MQKSVQVDPSLIEHPVFHLGYAKQILGEIPMDIKQDLSAEDFKLVFNTPLAAATLVAASSGGGFDMIKELTSASQFMASEAKKGGESGYGELVDSLLAAILGMSKDEGKTLEMQYEKSQDPKAMIAQVRQTVVNGWAVVAALPGADGFAKWVLDVARAAALAKTGGHFGFGNKSEIDAQEQAALDDLAGIMVVPAA